MSTWPSAALGEVAIIDRDGVDPARIKDGTLYVGLENIRSGGDLVDVVPVARGDLASSKFRFTADHVLFGKLRPYLAKVARPDFGGICSTDILPILPGGHLDRDYLAQFLLRPESVAWAASRSAGANLPRLSPTSLAQMRIPLPPVEEQRRVAALLDLADQLHAKRMDALGMLDALVQSVFVDLFGDPVKNSRGWRNLQLRDVISIPLRNGRSPSRTGTFTARVLTLSSVTGDRFDPAAWKSDTFVDEPSEQHTVSDLDLLICRGNGSLDRVGRGFFPTAPMPDIAFPDTIVAARVDADRIAPAFLEVLWNSAAVRRQIGTLARTTNGTYKVNQAMLEGVSLIAPPLSLQREFERRSAAVRRTKVTHRQSLAELEALFGSLQYRAFTGQL